MGAFGLRFWARGSAKGKRRVALIGCVERDLSTRLVLGVASNHAFERAGRLYAFANDVPGFYWNNRSVVELLIIRLE